LTNNDIELDRQSSRAADAHSDSSLKPARQDAPRYSELRRGLISLIVGMGSYYGTRYLGAAELTALMISTVVPALRVGYAAIRARRLDPIAAFLLAADGVTVVFGLASQSPVITMLGSHTPGIVFEIFLIAGLIRSRPITESLIEWFRPGWVHHHITNHAWTANDAHAYRRTHMRLTLAVAVAHAAPHCGNNCHLHTAGRHRQRTAWAPGTRRRRHRPGDRSRRNRILPAPLQNPTPTIPIRAATSRRTPLTAMQLDGCLTAIEEARAGGGFGSPGLNREHCPVELCQSTRSS
jgi:hypothetical protein